MYNMIQTTISGDVLGLSAQSAVFPLFYFLADKTVCMVLFSYNSNKPLKNSVLEFIEYPKEKKENE